MVARTAGSLFTIAIISSQYLVWHGLQAIIESAHTFRVVGQPSQRLTSSELLAEYRPDVIIIDMETERDVLEGIKELRASAPTCKVLLLSGFEDKDPVREALEYGVDGVMLKIHPPAVMLAAIDALCSSPKDRRRTGVDEATYMNLSRPLPATSELEARETMWPDALTEREREIIRLVKQGLSNKDIAYQLSISDSTVRHHLTSIFDKVGVPNRQKLMVHAQHVRLGPV